MAHGAIFIGFGRAARARERQALELFDQACQVCLELRERNEMESFEPVLLEPHAEISSDRAGGYRIPLQKD